MDATTGITIVLLAIANIHSMIQLSQIAYPVSYAYHSGIQTISIVCVRKASMCKVYVSITLRTFEHHTIGQGHH